MIESGGDNLAATFTNELVDHWAYVIDTAAGDDIPRKRGLGMLRADLLVVNKIDLAPYVGADLERMRGRRRGRPAWTTVAVHRPDAPDGADEVFAELRHAVLFDRDPARDIANT